MRLVVVRDSQLTTFLPSDKVVLVRKNISAIKLPRCRPIKIWTRRGIGGVYVYMYLRYYFSRVTTWKSRVPGVTYATRYIFPCTSASAMRVFMRAMPWCSKADENRGGGERGIRGTQLSYLACIIGALFRLPGTTLDCLDCHIVVTRYSLCIFAA